MESICSFIGHKPDKFLFKYDEEHIDCIKLKCKIIEEIEKIYLNGNKIFLTGCSIGVDMWCAEIILSMMKKYKDIQLYCVLPYENMEKIWTFNLKQRLNKIKNNSTKIIIIQKDYTKDCYFRRNTYLINKSKIIFSVYNEEIESNTKEMLNYALSQNKEIFVLNYKQNYIYKLTKNL